MRLPLALLLGVTVGTSGTPKSTAGEKDGPAEAKPANPESPHAGVNGPTAAGNASLRDILFSFKLDLRLTRGLYMGDRWVTPPTYTRVGEGKHCVVDIRAYGLSTRNQPVRISADWTVADPAAVTISQGPERTVKLTVKRPCQTSVNVACDGLCRKLSIKAVPHLDTILVEITGQDAVPKPGTGSPKAGQTENGQKTI